MKKKILFLLLIIAIVISNLGCVSNAEKAEDYYNEGLMLLLRGEYVDAIEKFDKVIAIYPKHKNAWHAKGVALHQLGRYSEAITCYDKAIGIDPNLALAWHYKGVALQALGRNTEAQECYNRAKELNKDD